MRITCIVPARNESGHLRSVIEGIIALDRVSEIIIVEGGSQDDTWEVAKNIQLSFAFPITVIKQQGKGKFAAVLTASEAAKYSHVLIWDADGTVSDQDTKKIIDEFNLHYSSSAVIGNRLLGRIYPGAMQTANWIGNWAFAILWWPFLGLGKPPRDLLCGTKIVPTYIFKCIPRWLISADPYGDFAILATLRSQKITVNSVTVDYYPRSYGSTNIKRWSGGMQLLFTSLIAFPWIVKNKIQRSRTGVPSQVYSEQLQTQRTNALKEPVYTYLSALYSYIDKELNFDSKYLEIGSGVGVSIEFLEGLNFVRTEFMESTVQEIRGNVDAHALPYGESEFDGVLLFDAFHHLVNPIDALQEILRVTKPGGKIILMEPYVSWLSYPIYRLFHFERTTWNYKFELAGVNEKTPGDGDQGISKALIMMLGNREIQTFDSISQWNCTYITPFSFFLTGGTTSPIKIPKFIIKLALSIESHIPNKIMKLIAARVFIVLSK